MPFSKGLKEGWYQMGGALILLKKFFFFSLYSMNQQALNSK